MPRNSTGPDTGQQRPHGPNTTGTIRKTGNKSKEDGNNNAESSSTSQRSSKGSSTASTTASSTVPKDRKRGDRKKVYFGNSYAEPRQPFSAWPGAKETLDVFEVSEITNMYNSLQVSESTSQESCLHPEECTGGKLEKKDLKTYSSDHPCSYCSHNSSRETQESSVSSQSKDEISHGRPTDVAEPAEPNKPNLVLNTKEIARIEAMLGVRAIWM